MYKKFCFVALIILLVVTSLPRNVEATGESKNAETLKIMINSEPVDIIQSYPTELLNNRVYVTFDIFEHPSIQATISDFNVEDGIIVSIYKGNININIDSRNDIYYITDLDDEEIVSGNEEYATSRKKLKWDGATPLIDGGKLMFPLKEIAELIGIQINWDHDTKTVHLSTNEEFQSDLESVKDWEEWMGYKPVDETFNPITEEELVSYITDNNQFIVDYKIESDSPAVVLEVKGSESSLYAMNRLRNGEIGEDSLTYWHSEDEEGFSVHRGYGFVGIVVHERAKEHGADYCVVRAVTNGVTSKEMVDLVGKQGILVKLPAANAVGTVTFYSDEGYVHDVMFW